MSCNTDSNWANTGRVLTMGFTCFMLNPLHAIVVKKPEYDRSISHPSRFVSVSNLFGSGKT